MKRTISKTSGLFTTNTGHAVHHTLLLEIDVEALFAKLGAKAANNRSGKTHLAGGLITIKAVPKP